MASFKEFTWKPDIGAMPSYVSTASQAKFGDGYEIRIPDNLHTVFKTWNLMFSRPLEEILEINNFLIEHAGITAFRWTDTLGNTSVYVCRGWNGPTQVDRGFYQLTATFEEVFES